MSPPLQTNLFINGEYVPSSAGETLSIYSPVDDSLVSDSVQVASEADVDRAVAAARAAFPAWRDTAGHKRAKCMIKFAEILERESGRLGELGRFFVIYSFDLVSGFVLLLQQGKLLYHLPSAASGFLMAVCCAIESQ